MRFVKVIATTALLTGAAAAALILPPTSDGPTAGDRARRSAAPAGRVLHPQSWDDRSDHPAGGHDRTAPTNGLEGQVAGEGERSLGGGPTGHPGSTAGSSADPSSLDASRGAGMTPARPSAGGGTHDAIVPELRWSGSGGSTPLAELELEDAVPTDFRIRPTTSQQVAGPAGDGPSGYSASDGCASSCITRGTAHARGFGALLVVESRVEARWFISVVGPDDSTDVWAEPGMRTSVQWGIDHLEPGTTYDVLATATDSFGNVDYAWGSFTTLAHRDITYSFGEVEVSGGPSDIESTSLFFSYDGGPLADVTPGQAPIMLLKDVDRYADLEFWVVRRWDGSLCQAFDIDSDTPDYGWSDASCLAWNSARVDDLDLDQAPGGTSYWTSTTVETALEPSPATGALPAGYGWSYFDFAVPMTINVSYS